MNNVYKAGNLPHFIMLFLSLYKRESFYTVDQTTGAPAGWGFIPLWNQLCLRLIQPETSVVISVKLNFYYLVIKAAAMAKPDGFLLTLQLLLFYGVGENWTKGSRALYKIKAIIPTFLRHGGHWGGHREVQSSYKGGICVFLCKCVKPIWHICIHKLQAFLHG